MFRFVYIVFSREETFACVCVCLRVYATYVSACTCVYVHVPGSQPQVPSTFVLRQSVSLGPEPAGLGSLAGKLQRSAHLCPPPWYPFTWPFPQMLGIKLGSSCLHSKHFTETTLSHRQLEYLCGPAEVVLSHPDPHCHPLPSNQSSFLFIFYSTPRANLLKTKTKS